MFWNIVFLVLKSVLLIYNSNVVYLFLLEHIIYSLSCVLCRGGLTVALLVCKVKLTVYCLFEIGLDGHLLCWCLKLHFVQLLPRCGPCTGSTGVNDCIFWCFWIAECNSAMRSACGRGKWGVMGF